jgi:hypothetical protein
MSKEVPLCTAIKSVTEVRASTGATGRAEAGEKIPTPAAVIAATLIV